MNTKKISRQFALAASLRQTIGPKFVEKKFNCCSR